MRPAWILASLALCIALASATVSVDVGRPDILAHVANTFVGKGFARVDPFDLSPQEMAHLNSQVDDMLQESLIEAQAETEDENKNPEAVLASLRETVSAMEQSNLQATQSLEDRLRLNEQMKQTAADSVEPQLLEADATARTEGVFNKLHHIKQHLHGGDHDKFPAQRYEDCMACRFIWKQVEMDVSNAKYVEDVQASFEHNCLDAQKSTVFYKACEDMYDDMYALTDDYMSSDFTVDKMCQRANMCKL